VQQVVAEVTAAREYSRKQRGDNTFSTVMSCPCYRRDGDLSYASFCNRAGYSLSKNVDHDGALEKFQAAFSIHESGLGTNHPDAAFSGNKIGKVLHIKDNHGIALADRVPKGP
jgi:hypothetical protein